MAISTPSCQEEYDRRLREMEEQEGLLKCTKDSVNKLKEDVSSLAKELEEYQLIKKWGKQSDKVMRPEEEALKICQKVEDEPELLASILSSLKYQQTKMEAEVAESRARLKAAEREKTT
ncbi:uncharacterized protein LOC117100426 [Anneissia japonica]|uniref:uncharacterized protein LOC117100426 n=1 Tax=Anneissia japonica TaxID=1529436 RepID=UPI0014258ECF|nr:uncharacterized protein LOC117100426 [Anneissia japonica]